MKRTQSLLILLIVFCFAFTTSFVFAEKGQSEPSNSGSGNVSQSDDNSADQNDADDNSLDNAKKDWETQQAEIKSKKDKLSAEGKKKSFEVAQKVVLKIIDRGIAKLTKLKARVNKISALSQEKKTEIGALIDEQINKLNDLKDDVNNATTKEELKTVSGEVREILKNTKDIIKSIVSDVLEARIAELIDKLGKISEKLSEKIDALKAKSVDMAELEALLDEANGNLAEASNLLNANKFKEAHASAEKARTNLAKLAGQIKAAEAKLEDDNN